MAARQTAKVIPRRKRTPLAPERLADAVTREVAEQLGALSRNIDTIIVLVKADIDRDRSEGG